MLGVLYGSRVCRVQRDTRSGTQGFPHDVCAEQFHRVMGIFKVLFYQSNM